MDSNQQDMVAEFSSVTGANPSVAQTALSSANWNLQEAVGLYFAASEDPQHDHDEDYDEDDDTPVASAPQPSTANQPQQGGMSRSNPAQPRRIPGQGPRAMTLRDLQGGGDDEEEDDDKDPNLYTGGEKSGLAVENPDNRSGGPVDHFRNIMSQARANRDRPGGDDEPARPQRSANFSGRAQTLGGDDAPSQVVEDPTANRPTARQPPPRVSRTMHLWADGVSIDDGPLFRFDDPANQDMMAQINQGRAPMSLLDVQPEQEVDLNLMPHKEENYVQPKKQYKPFGGQGQRLGSPTPGPAPSSSSTTTTRSSAQPAAASSGSASKPAEMPVDDAQPTLQLQVRLGDGTRLQSRFNTSHTIGDVYDFVDRASPASSQRPYALMTTFPSKELEDKAQVLGDMADFKRGGVVVQKWK